MNLPGYPKLERALLIAIGYKVTMSAQRSKAYIFVLSR